MQFLSFVILMFPFYSIVSVLMMIVQTLLIYSAETFFIKYIPLFLSFAAVNIFVLCIFFDTGVPRDLSGLVSSSFITAAAFFGDLAFVLIDVISRKTLSGHIRRCLDA